MGLLQPETGLLFWMVLAFGIVFFLVAKFGFPVIIKAIDSRKEYVDSSLSAARKARQQLSELETERRMMRMEAEAERSDILRTASEERERMMDEARKQAAAERARLVAEAAPRPKRNVKPFCGTPGSRLPCWPWPLPRRCFAASCRTRVRRRHWPSNCSMKSETLK